MAKLYKKYQHLEKNKKQKIRKNKANTIKTTKTKYKLFNWKKEVLFIKNDIAKIKDDKYDYSKLIKYYKRKLVDYEAMKQLEGFKSEGKFTSKVKIKDIIEKKNLTA